MRFCVRVRRHRRRLLSECMRSRRRLAGATLCCACTSIAVSIHLQRITHGVVGIAYMFGEEKKQLARRACASTRSMRAAWPCACTIRVNSAPNKVIHTSEYHLPLAAAPTPSGYLSDSRSTGAQRARAHTSPNASTGCTLTAPPLSAHSNR